MSTQVLTASYIVNHMRGVHTPESWGRAVIEQALHAAASRVQTPGAGPMTNVDVGAQIAVAAYEPAGCITVTATVNGVTVSYHQNV